MPTVYPAPFPGSVLNPGDTVPIPSSIPTGVGPVDRVGRDLDPAGQKGVLIGGAANLQNALLRRLRTPLGYLPQHPEYGSRLAAFRGRAVDLAYVVTLRQEVARVLSADPHVLSIQTLTVDVASDVISVRAQLQTVLGLLNFGGAIAPSGG